MSRYIDTDELIVIGLDNPDCEHQFEFVPWEFIENAPTADVVSRKEYDKLNERYKRLLESANILADAVRKYERREDER